MNTTPKRPFYVELSEMDRPVKEERKAKRAEKKYTASELQAKLQAQSSKRPAESLGGMSEDEIRRELKDAGIEPLGVEVNNSGTLTVWINGSRKREGRLVPRKFVARRLETVILQIKRHLSDRARSGHKSSAVAPQELGRRER